MSLFVWLKNSGRVNTRKKSHVIEWDGKHSPYKPKPAALHISWEPLSDLHTLVKVDGVLNETSTDYFENKLLSCISSDQVRLILDLRNLSYVSSQGWGILISLLQRIRQVNGDIKIVEMQTSVRHVFKQTGLENIFESYANISQAQAVFK